MENGKFKVGDQVLYIPTHAEGDPSHPDCEEGFVTSVGANGAVFCRYFFPRHGGIRTRANSESTYPDDLILFNHRSPAEIQRMLNEIEKSGGWL